LTLSPRISQRESTGKLKVCHVVATTEGAGWMVAQLRELRDRYGFDVTAIVSGERGGLIDKLCAEGIPYRVANFEFSSPRGMMRMPLEIFRMARFFRRERFDVVQTHLFFSMLAGRIAAWLADVPVRLSMIAGPFHLEAHTSLWIDRATCWMETAMIPACEKSYRMCREMGVPPERLALIYYAPDERKFNPEETPPANIRAEFGWPENTPLIGMVAYFYARLSVSRWIPLAVQGNGVKGHEDLVKAAPMVLSEFPNAKFLLAGSGWGEAGEAHMEEVKELVRSMGLQESVIFTGFRHDVNGILREVDVAVQASLSECLGGTIESLLMECPTVVTRVGGMVDIIRDGETGVLVNPADPDDLARGIIQLLGDPQRARALGRAGRKLALERFTFSRTVSDLDELYRRQRAEKRRKPYNPLISLWRLVVGVPVFAYLAFRLLVIDIYLPIYFPIHRARARGFFTRIPILRSLRIFR
jgi:glycosyltransferase involved in cell wall biosynthesis